MYGSCWTANHAVTLDRNHGVHRNKKRHRLLHHLLHRPSPVLTRLSATRVLYSASGISASAALHWPMKIHHSNGVGTAIRGAPSHKHKEENKRRGGVLSSDMCVKSGFDWSKRAPRTLYHHAARKKERDCCRGGSHVERNTIQLVRPHVGPTLQTSASPEKKSLIFDPESWNIHILYNNLLEFRTLVIQVTLGDQCERKQGYLVADLIPPQWGVEEKPTEVCLESAIKGQCQSAHHWALSQTCFVFLIMLERKAKLNINPWIWMSSNHTATSLFYN